MKIIVTGGAGFIGAHVVGKLLSAGEEVIVLDNLSRGKASNVPAPAKLIVLDICDLCARNFFAQENFDAVIHLAGQTLVDTSVKNPVLDAQENILGLINILEGMKNSAKPRRFIFASTAAVYGDIHEKFLPVLETQNTAPTSFYGLSKLTAEKYIAMYRRAGVDFVVFRFANVFGELQGDSGEGGVISIFAKKIARGDKLTIFGSGEQTRDFIYAGDVAEGIFRALYTENLNAVYNLGTQTETSINQLVKIFAEISGKQIEIEYASARAGDIYRSVLSNEKAKSKLHWQPRASFKENLSRTYKYFVNTRR